MRVILPVISAAERNCTEAASAAKPNQRFNFIESKRTFNFVKTRGQPISGKTTPQDFSKKLQEVYAAEAKDNKLPPVPAR